MSLVDDDWHASALDRIEQIRKRDVVLTVSDENGCPLSGAHVEISQLRRHFAFGSCFNKNQLKNQQYLDFFKNNFEWAVHENAAKWCQNEWTQGSVNYEDADAVLSFCHANDIRMRGHCLFWANPIGFRIGLNLSRTKTSYLRWMHELKMQSLIFVGNFIIGT